jgi:hypothetical protein
MRVFFLTRYSKNGNVDFDFPFQRIATIQNDALCIQTGLAKIHESRINSSL